MNKKDIVVLSDKNKYLIICKTNYNDKNYYYLQDIKNIENIKFCYEQDGYMIESEDEDFNKKLLLLFFKDLYSKK